MFRQCDIIWFSFYIYRIRNKLLLSVLLRYTDSDCPFGIFKLFLTRWVSLVEPELLTILQHMGSPPVLSVGRVAWSLAFWVMFCRSLLSFFLLPLYCLSFYDIQIEITPLISSNLSYIISFAHAITYCKLLYNGEDFISWKNLLPIQKDPW